MISEEEMIRMETRALERGEGATAKNTAWLCNTIRNLKEQLEKGQAKKPPAELHAKDACSINLNDNIYFKITEFGKDILDRYYAQFNQNLEPVLHGTGEYKLQIYEFMTIFGPHIRMGMRDSKNPFESMNMWINKF